MCGQVHRERPSESRDAMIEQWMPLVRSVVRQMQSRGSLRTFDSDDLVGYGTLGLIQAVDRYDASRGVSFPSYAVSRIRGAIVDAMREADLLTRGVRGSATRLELVTERLTVRLQRTPTRDEIQQEARLNDREYDRAASAARVRVVSFDQLSAGAREDDHVRSEPLQLAADTEPVGAAIEHRELVAELATAIRALPEREKLVLSLYWWEGLTLKEVGQVLGVSESRVTQIRMRAIDRLRHCMRLREAA